MHVLKYPLCGNLFPCKFAHVSVYNFFIPFLLLPLETIDIESITSYIHVAECSKEVEKNREKQREQLIKKRDHIVLKQSLTC